MSDAIEEIRCALAMRDAGYAVLFDHETSAELLRRYDIAVKALEAIANMEPATTDITLAHAMAQEAKDALGAVEPSRESGK